MSLGWAVGWALPALLAWFIVLIAPWRPWSTRECLEADAQRQRESLDDVTVLIPARDEAETLPKTLACLWRQGPGLDILVVDDQSCDSTGSIAQGSGVAGVRVISGAALPEGWTGKSGLKRRHDRFSTVPWSCCSTPTSPSHRA